MQKWCNNPLWRRWQSDDRAREIVMLRCIYVYMYRCIYMYMCEENDATISCGGDGKATTGLEKYSCLDAYMYICTRRQCRRNILQWICMHVCSLTSEGGCCLIFLTYFGYFQILWIFSNKVTFTICPSGRKRHRVCLTVTVTVSVRPWPSPCLSDRDRHYVRHHDSDSDTMTVTVTPWQWQWLWADSTPNFD